MRYCLLLVVLAAPLGCGGSDAGEKPKSADIADLRTRKDGSDWPTFLGPAGTGASTETGIVAPWPEKGPRVVWQNPVGAGYAPPVISKGRLFHFDREGKKARLNCWNAETGEPLWKYEYPTDYLDKYGYNGGPRSSPVVDGDRVYAHGVEGMLLCLRTNDGKLLWKVDTFADFGVVPNFFGVGSAPAVEGDLLLVMVGGSPKGSDKLDIGDVKGNGSGVVAFDKHTGKVRWKLSDELASYSSPVLASIGGRRWGFVFARGGLLAFEPKTGKLDFHFPWRAEDLESANAANPVVIGNQVLISETYGPGAALLEVKPGACKEIWSDKGRRRGKSLQAHWATPIHVDGFVYGCSGRHPQNAELRCLELATGKVTWTEPGMTRTSLLLVENHFVCLAEDGMLYLLRVNPRRYHEVSRVELTDANGKALLDYPCWAAPVLAHGLMYVRSENRMVCLELIPQKK